MLQEADTRAWETTDLTKSFGWQQNQAGDQQDIHELNRVLLDAIEQAMEGTPYSSLIRELFFGQLDTVVICSQCKTQRRTPEPFLDLALAVKGHKSLQESLAAHVSFEDLGPDNLLTCDVCGTKT